MHERYREAETQAEGEAGCLREARCGTRSQDPGISTWAEGRCSTTGATQESPQVHFYEPLGCQPGRGSQMQTPSPEWSEERAGHRHTAGKWLPGTQPWVVTCCWATSRVNCVPSLSSAPTRLGEPAEGIVLMGWGDQGFPESLPFLCLPCPMGSYGS